jgi:mRNA-degrading endonuclease YafQ of YafQ-DinJ toxin-antitoxin module
MTWRVEYTNEFVSRFRELNFGQRLLVEGSIKSIVSLDDPTILAHHLERRAYFCNWSHRVRSNLILVFRISKQSLTFISTGTHSQAYRPTA